MGILTTTIYHNKNRVSVNMGGRGGRGGHLVKILVGGAFVPFLDFDGVTSSTSPVYRYPYKYFV